MTSGQKLAALFWVGLVGWMVMRSGSTPPLASASAPATSALPVAATDAGTVPPASEGAPGPWSKLNLRDLALDMPGKPAQATTVETDPDDGEVTTRHDFRLERDDLFIKATYVEFTGNVANAALAADKSAEVVLAKAREQGGMVAIVFNRRRVIGGTPGREVFARVSAADGPYQLRLAYVYRGPIVYEIVTTSLADTDGEEDAARLLASLRTINAPDPIAPSIAIRRAPPQAARQPIATGPVAAGADSPQFYYSSPSYGGAAPAVPEYHGPVHVTGYTRKDGTYVQPYTRRAPRR
jgi:hypothetical protein